MAYSNIGTPVFYVDNFLYQKTMGTTFIDLPSTLTAQNEIDDGTNFIRHIDSPDLYSLKPIMAKEYSYTGTDALIDFVISVPMYGLGNDNTYDTTGNYKFYYALLNHDFYSHLMLAGNDQYQEILHVSEFMESSNITFELNTTDFGDGMLSGKHGSSIISFDKMLPAEHPYLAIGGFYQRNSLNLGAVSVGVKYTMPHSPDLKLSMEIEMDGIDTITTSGGASISNIKYTGNPLWVNKGNQTNPFDLYSEDISNETARIRRNGRRSWNFKFSYISDKDLFSSNIKSGTYSDHESDGTIADHYDSGDLENEELYFNIETDDSFYAQVWNKTLGGALPFIFQPDSNFRDEFYICKFDQDSLKISQSAYKVYDVSVKIVEVW